MIKQGYIVCKILWSDKKRRLRGKNEKGERKTKENYVKNGEKAVMWMFFFVGNYCFQV